MASLVEAAHDVPAREDRFRLISLREIMRSIRLDVLVSLIASLHFTAALQQLIADDEPFVATDDAKSLMGYHEDDLTALEFPASVTTIQKIRKAFAAGESGVEVARLQRELNERITDEAAMRMFFRLTMEEARLYSNPLEKWETIVDRFPNVIDDVEEAAKCWAVSRYAASVYHTTQIVEHGMIELGKFLRAPGSKPGFTETMNEVKRILGKPYPTRNRFEKKHFAFLEQVHGSVSPLQAAWRNKISHADGKLTLLTKEFSPEVSEDIFYATRGLMRRLAVDMPRKR